MLSNCCHQDHPHVPPNVIKSFHLPSCTPPAPQLLVTAPLLPTEITGQRSPMRGRRPGTGLSMLYYTVAGRCSIRAKQVPWELYLLLSLCR